MKKNVVFIILMLLMLPVSLMADSYTSLWKQVDAARQKDLPRTQIKWLRQIVVKAKAEAQYGQLLQAQTSLADIEASISPDSIPAVVKRIEADAASYDKKDPAVAAVYYAVLASLYANNPELGSDRVNVSNRYAAKAMADPAMLAQKKATDFLPFVVKGRDSKYFNDDLLSLIGYHLRDFKPMHDYYEKAGNRLATMFTALDMVRTEYDEIPDYTHKLSKSPYIVTLDSLINLYSDLPECGEIAVERYQSMNTKTDVTTEDKVNYITWALNRWGAWKGTNALRNDMKALTAPLFNISTKRNIINTATDLGIRVKVRHLDKLTVTLSRLNLDGATELDPGAGNDLKKLRAKIIPGTTVTLSLNAAGRPDWQEVTDTLHTGKLPLGVYLVEASADKSGLKPRYSLLQVTDLFIINQKLPEGKTRVAVVNARTSQPVAGAMLYVETSDEKKQAYTTDAGGEVTVESKTSDISRMRATTTADSAMPWTYTYNNFFYYDNDGSIDRAALYTDRAIYRPGQTVHVSVISYNCKDLDRKANAGRSLKLTLRDANSKTVAEKSVTTDDYGVASADFALPSDGLTGMYRISCQGSGTYLTTFRVEEYKRPTFKIELPEVKEKYQNGDTLVIVGHARTYAGVPVQGAAVKYKVSRLQTFWWINALRGYVEIDNNSNLAEATDTTGSNGEFTLRIPMMLPKYVQGSSDADDNAYKISPRFYTIDTNIDVTDVSGETQHGSLSLPLGTKNTVLGVKLPEKSLRDSLKTITFGYKNAAGHDIPATVTYRIDNSQTTYTAAANVETKIEWNTPDLLKSGEHTLTAVCGTDTVKHKFTVFSLDDTKPCTETHDWFYATSNKFSSDKPVYIQVGSSDKNVHVFYTVISGNKVIDKGTFDLNNSICKQAFTYKEEYGSGVQITYAWVKGGVFYNHSQQLARPLPDKRLNLKWTTFRDRLTPGQKETWTLNIAGPDGRAAKASLMAVLYDSSLDQIERNDWAFDPGLYQNLPSSYWRGISYGRIIMNNNADVRFLDDASLAFNRMIFAQSLGRNGRIVNYAFSSGVVTGRPVMMKAVETSSAQRDMSAQDLQFDHVAKPEVSYEAVKCKSNGTIGSLGSPTTEMPSSEDGEGANAGQVQVRENLNETAFFYPSLLADAEGNVKVSFTLPESVTTWRFMGLAHDRDMNYGLLDGTAVASKKVMILPNMPRFLRAGDEATLTARIFNTTDKKQKGTATLLLIDPETEQTVLSRKVNFAVEDSATTTATYNFKLSDKYPILICKVIAEGKDFSDGEQHYLPVLPDKEMIVNTVPFIQNTKGEKTVSLKPLFLDGATHRKLTVEYTNNPAWLVVQALPYVGTASDEDVISLATAVYANTLGLNLVSSTPKIKSVFEQWSREAEADKNGSLASQLSKDQDLKTLVLNETPWVMDADNEAEQKRSLSNFFDESGMTNRINRSLQAMQKLQNADGSWSWWPGMTGSPRLTSAVMQQMARMNYLTGRKEDDSKMNTLALSFLRKKATEEVEEMKKAEKENRPVLISDYYALQYLYINALYGRKLTAEEESAARYLLAYLKKNNALNSLYSKALMAVVLAQRGDKVTAQDYVQSLEEYTVATEEMGRYYDSRRAEYSWQSYQIPTQVAAIEAMQLVDAAKYGKEIDEMRRWLLRQKQTQAWSTPINSVDAIYAFLVGNKDVLAAKPESIIKVDGRQIELPQVTAGLGYVKTSAVNPDGSTLTVTKTSEGTSWGAVYAQQMAKTSEIDAAKSGLMVTREILNVDGSKATGLKVGDKVKVRITITADRNYDYVMVKDSRAACMEPASQLSRYFWGYYCTPKDCSTNYYFDMMSKGKHVVETEYYIDRAGRYETGSCTVQCAYSPEYTARTASEIVEVK